MKKLIYNNGKTTVVNVPDDFEPIKSCWHNEKPFRVTVNNEVWKDWFSKKRDHADYIELTGQLLYPDLIALLDVVKSIDNTNIVNDSENTYVYLDEVFNYHLPIIAKYNAIFETKPI